MNGQYEKLPAICTCGASNGEETPTCGPASRHGSIAVGANNELCPSAIAREGPRVSFTEALQAPVAFPRTTGQSSRRTSSAKRSSSLPSSSTRRGSSRRASPAKRARSSRRASSPRRRSVSRSTKAPKVGRRPSLPRKRRQTVDYSALASDWIYQYAFGSPSSPQYPPQPSSPALAADAGVVGQYQPSSLGQAQAPMVLPMVPQLPVVPQVQVPVLWPTSPPFKVIRPPRLIYGYSERQMHTSFLPQPDPPGWDSVLRFSLAVAGASILILTIMVAMYIIVISKREPTEENVFASATPPWLGHV